MSLVGAGSQSSPQYHASRAKNLSLQKAAGWLVIYLPKTMGDSGTTKSCQVPYSVDEQLHYSLNETHTWAISLEIKSYTFIFLHFGSRCLGFPWRKVKTLRMRMLIYSSWAAVYKFPMCTLSIHITATLGGTAAFPGCTTQPFSHCVLKWVVRDLTHIHTVNMDSSGSLQ